MGPQLVRHQEQPADDIRRDPALQASLFGPQEAAKQLKPAGMKPQSPAVARPGSRARRVKNSQQAFDFGAAIPEGLRTRQTSSDGAIYCDAPVAITAHRAMAAIIDTGIAFLGLGVFLLTFHLGGQEIVLNRLSLTVYTITGLLISLFYHILYCAGNGDTPGLRCVGLRLLNFDGHMPTRHQRFCRLAGACLSVVAAGLGLLWAMVDEERLTWHDHMSKTFPTFTQ